MSKQQLQNIKDEIEAAIDEHKDALIALSLRLHSQPEVGFQEKKAAAWLADYLESEGFSVERGICDLPTAFRATDGRGKPAVGFLAEYDALPKLGHACGHNLIAASAVGAALGVRHVLRRRAGRITVVGTPAEEVGATKGLMAQRGAFDGLDAAMLVHPGSHDSASEQALACIGLNVEFLGKAAHAAVRPEDGINALNALILSFNAIDALRQHIPGTARVHGIITAGGEAANIVPHYAAGSFLVRALDLGYLEVLKDRVIGCFEGAARATGAQLRYQWTDDVYAPLRQNQPLANLFAQNLQMLGRAVSPPDTSGQGLGSTDMGNVSQVVPAIHPSLAIVPHRISLHSPEFAQAAGSSAGQEGMLLAAKAMAWTAADLILQPAELARVKADFLAEG